LAYLLGLEGIALLHAFAGEYDRDFTLDRLAEIRALLAAGQELGDGVMADPIPTTEGYGSWAEFYDEPGNQLIDVEQPIVRETLDGLPRGIALDASTLQLPSHSACWCAGAKSPGRRSRSSTTAASRPTGRRTPIRFPVRRRTSGRCIVGLPHSG